MSLFDDPAALVRAITEASDDVIFAKDLQGRYLFANPAMLAVVGKPPREVIGSTDLEIMPDREVAQQLMENDRMVLREGRVVEMEETVPRPGGAPAHFQARKMPLRDAGGAIVGLLGIARDITQRKLAEQQRDATRLKLEMGIQAAGLVMAEIDYRTNLNHISAQLARLLELGDQEMTVPRQAIFDRIHPDDRDRYLQEIARTIDPRGSGHLAIDVRAMLPSGTVRWLHIRLQVTFSLVDGQLKPDKGICAARDVTTEMVAERKLRAAQRLTQSVIEGAGALVYAKDLKGRYILSNQAWRNMHGLAPEQAEGITDDDLFGKATAAELRANDRAVIERGEPILVQERTVLNGQHTTFRSSKFPLYDEAGQVYAVCGVSTDITDVVEADRRKDEFIATLAHELRNPLAPIRTGLEILRRVGELPPAAARTRDMMERQLTHLVRLVDDLLDVSRISRGKLELRQECVPVAQALADAIEACQAGIEAARHQLVVHEPGDAWQVRGDLTRLAQVFTNLLNNAIKYTPPGGRIEIRVRRDGEHVAVEVVDNGSGIPAEALPHVFALFAQGHRSGPGGQGGLGIGLWLVRRLVEMHQGSIAAESAGPGAGSRFEVRLPLLVS